MVGAQQANVELLNRLTGLTHDIFVGTVKDAVRRSSVTSTMFQKADPGEYKFGGQKMKFATDLRFKTGGLATSGYTPDYVPMDAVQGEIVPTRRYAAFAIDNLIELLASGEGSFEDVGDRIFKHLWSAWESMEKRHSVGDSSGAVCLVASRTSSTVFVVKDGYGHEGANPLLHLSEGAIIGWYDVSHSAVGGAGVITNTGIAYDTKTITVSSAGTWEPSETLAADDIIFFATTPNITSDRFELERNLAPNGLANIVDPDANYSTVHGIAEGNYQRWKPVRQPSVTLDHLEVTEFFLKLAAKRGFAVSPNSDACITHPAIVAQINRSLIAFQQQAYTGGELKGGYSLGGASGNEEDLRPAASGTVGGLPMYADGFAYQDVFSVLCLETLFRVEIGGDADYWSGDGSMWQRIAGYDGKDGFVTHYMNHLSNHRGAHGALVGCTTELNPDDFSAGVPDY